VRSPASRTKSLPVVVAGLLLAGCGSNFGFVPDDVPEPPLLFGVPATLQATVGEEFKFSFCRPELNSSSDLCPKGATNPTGGSPPYHFQLGSGVGFPPVGLTLGLNGILSGTPTVATSSLGGGEFSVCAVDLSGTSVCRTVKMTIVGTITVGQVSWSCKISAAPLPGWRNCTGTVELTISKVITSGFVSVFFNYPDDGAFFHGELAVTSGGPAQKVTVNVVNEFVSKCVTFATTIDVFDGRQNAGQAPLLVSVPITFTPTCS